jgi:methionyl-tRNA formyltransferase
LGGGVLKMKFLILGPKWRNQEILDFIISRGSSGQIIDSEVTLEFIQRNNYEIILSSGYAYKVAADVVEAYFGKIINLHATFLPWGKGIGTTLFSFLEGTPKGVSLHLIDKEFDTGDIIAQRQVAYSKTDTLRTIYAHLLKETTQLFYENFDSIVNASFKRTPQKSANATVHYHSRVESEHFMDLLPLVWDTPLTQIEELGAELAISESFWGAIEAEIG